MNDRIKLTNEGRRNSVLWVPLADIVSAERVWHPEGDFTIVRFRTGFPQTVSETPEQIQHLIRLCDPSRRIQKSESA